jgi:rhodanese-related sulfurtransferase
LRRTCSPLRRYGSCRVALVLLIVILATAAFTEEADPAEAPGISPAELHERRESGTAPVVIDVRTAEEYASGHVPGAVNIPFDQVAQRIAELDAPRGVALYCMVGPRARKGESALLAAGYESVLHLEGGLAAWQAAGLPVERAQ